MFAGFLVPLDFMKFNTFGPRWFSSPDKFCTHHQVIFVFTETMQQFFEKKNNIDPKFTLATCTLGFWRILGPQRLI